MVNKVLPSQIAIYRDGVGGPSYQKYVVEYEIPGVEALLKGYSQGYAPRLLYCLVDKKINTRLIEKKNNEIHQNEMRNLKEKQHAAIEALKAQQLEVVRRLESEILALKQRPLQMPAIE